MSVQNEDTVRIVRILEYVGKRSAVEQTLAKGAVPMNGQYTTINGSMTIRSAAIGSFAEIIQSAQEAVTNVNTR